MNRNCRACGTALSSEAERCPRCGAAVDAAAPSGARDREADRALLADRLRPRPVEFRARPPEPAPLTEAEKLRRAAADRPHDARAQLALGEHLEKAGDVAAAEASYRRALQIAPRNGMVLVRLGRLLAGAGKRDEALRRLAGAVQAEPALPAVHAALGDFHLPHGPAAAIQAYRAGVKRHPEDNPLRYRLISALLAHERRGAKVALAELVRADPQNAWARVQLEELTGTRSCPAVKFDRARELEREGRGDEAIAAYEEAAREPGFAWAAYDAERLARRPAGG